MKKLFVLAALIQAVSFSSAYADDTSSGCGLGWQVVKKQSLVSSSLRSTTNNFLPNTFSMTSGTSGCAKHEIVQGDEKAVQYAVNNYDSIVVEMAQKDGEFLRGFALALGCNTASVDRFENVTHAQYRDLLQASDVSVGMGEHEGIGFYRAVRQRIQADPELRAVCLPANAV